jgi:hypothetical protein
LIGIKALRAHQQLVLALLDDLSAQLFELELLATPIAHCNSYAA